MHKPNGCGVTIKMKYGATVCGNEYRGVPMRCDACEKAAPRGAFARVPLEPITGPRYAAGDWSRRNWEAALEDQLNGGDHVHG